MPPTRVLANPLRTRAAGLPEADLARAAAFAPHLPATPLRDARALAARLGLSQLLIKNETARWGLNAFKITGASYAIATRLDDAQEERAPRRIVTASAGNHGRAVARAARDRGVPCRVYLPADALPARIDAIRGEGADVIQLAGSYEDAVERAAEDAQDEGALLVSDTTPPGDAAIPALILRGYTKIFSEAAAAWTEPPDLVVIQGGVGGLVGAAAGWMRTRLPAATLLAVEPNGSACLRASALAGHPATLAATEPTSMVCLRCAAPSAAAWPLIAAGVDGFITVSDAEASAAVQALADSSPGPGIAAGASGACGLAGLIAAAPEFPRARALIVVTEAP